jgi:hypothetical protein
MLRSHFAMAAGRTARTYRLGNEGIRPDFAHLKMLIVETETSPLPLCHPIFSMLCDRVIPTLTSGVHFFRLLLSKEQ